MTPFQIAMAFVLKHEDSHPSGLVTKDAGGVTKYGIASKYHPNVDVANLTLPGAESIYFKEYWQPYHLDLLTSPAVSAKIFDCLVNPGQGFAKTIQWLVEIHEDGIIGPQTIASLNACNPEVLMVSLCNAQAEHYREHDADNPDLEGLLTRAADQPEVV